jgi:hypothetical protein
MQAMKRPLFLDPDTPIATCTASDCSSCGLQKVVNCHFSLKQLARFLAFAVSAMIVGGYGIFMFQPWLLLGWVVGFVSFFGVIEIRVLCSHCPHYAQPQAKILRCWANYGSPRLWKYRPGSMSTAEKTIFFLGVTAIIGFPLACFLLNPVRIHVFALILYATLLGVGYVLLKKHYCSICMNFACPLNTVEKQVRQLFLAKNTRMKDGG